MRLPLLIFLFVWAVSLKAQVNLVPNPSFEETDSCPNYLGEIENAIGWWSSKPSPDYFHSCGAQSLSIPYNNFGYQDVVDGNAYAGFWAYGFGNARECISTELNEPMVIGKRYIFSVNVNRADFYSHPFLYPNASCNKLGVIFSTEEFNLNNPIPINNWAHIYSDSVIQDTINWITIQGSFISDDFYSYINIGNFFDDNHTDILIDTVLSTSKPPLLHT